MAYFNSFKPFYVLSDEIVLKKSSCLYIWRTKWRTLYLLSYDRFKFIYNRFKFIV